LWQIINIWLTYLGVSNIKQNLLEKLKSATGIGLWLEIYDATRIVGYNGLGRKTWLEKMAE
jgi:ABC-type branched-subunit amino acid transport system ATPase component